MNETQANRLLKLAKYLREKVKPEEFDLGSFSEFVSLDKGKAAEDLCEIRNRSLSFLDAKTATPLCGSTACALGYATNIWPRRFVLRIEKSRYGNLFCAKTGKELEFDSPIIQDFFGINGEECEILFSPDHSRTPAKEADMIEGVVLSQYPKAVNRDVT